MLLRALLVLFLFIAIFVASAFANPIPKRQADQSFKPQYGISYSFEQAGWYGLDPRESYTKMLDDFEFSWVRLPFFWNKMVDDQGNLKIDDLKFAIEEAQKHNTKVIIALGVKTPYYPEYHWPKDVESKVKFGERFNLNSPVAPDILAIDKKVVEALLAYDNIAYWQVENEPLIGNVNKWKIEPDLVAKEVETVRANDPKRRPVILNHAGVGFWDQSWKKLLPILKPRDVFAVNAFFKTKSIDIFTAKIFSKEVHVAWPKHFVWPVQSWGFISPNFGSIKKQVEANGNRFWVMEMQAEPYVKNLQQASGPSLSYKPQDIKAASNYLRSYKIESVGLWGIHFWQYGEKRGDDSWIKEARSVVNQ